MRIAIAGGRGPVVPPVVLTPSTIPGGSVVPPPAPLLWNVPIAGVEPQELAVVDAEDDDIVKAVEAVTLDVVKSVVPLDD